MSRITLKDIANRLGVSKATISLALRGSREIGEETRKKIIKTAKEMGYRPDPTLAKIAASRWKPHIASEQIPLAFVASLHPDHEKLIPEDAKKHPLPYLKDSEHQEEWVIYLSGHAHFKGAIQRADELGYSMSYHLYKPGDNIRSLSNALYHRGVQGIIFSPIFDRDFIKHFQWKRFACVSVADHYYLPPTDFVVPKLSSHIHVVFSHLYRKGYSRPGLVLYHEKIQHLNNHILRGVFLSLCESVGILNNIPAPYYVEHSKLENIKPWLDKEMPDVIIGFSDFIYDLLANFGYKMPQDYSFVSLGVKKPKEKLIAGVIDADFMMGRTGVDILDHKLRHGIFGPTERRTFTTIQTDWCEGKSLPKKKGVSPAELRKIKENADFLNIFADPKSIDVAP